jgi:triosephosphate isomerase (TIM)
MSEPVEARTLFVAGNWKMHKLRAEARAFADALSERIDDLDEVDLAIAPPFTCLTEVADILVPLGVGVLGQTAHAAPSGAFTGEVAMAMLADAGATGVLLGHSERRQLFGETDDALAEKVPAALAAGLEPVLCVGETEAEREAGETEARLTTQVTRGLEHVVAGQVADVTVAYEPVWAIGTGKTATPEIAQAAHAHLRAVLAELFGDEAAQAIRIQYGGSVKPDNAAELFAQADIDGGLIGGASLAVDDFAAIALAAVPRA